MLYIDTLCESISKIKLTEDEEPSFKKVINYYDKPINKFRKKYFLLFVDLFDKYHIDKKRNFYMANYIEVHCFNGSRIKYSTSRNLHIRKINYSHRIRHIYVNINPSSYVCKKLPREDIILFKLISKSMNVSDLFTKDNQIIKPWDMYPKLHSEFLNDTFCIYNTDPNKMKDGILKCNKCKKYKTTYTEKQTRSSDEPSTKFAYCFICDKRWKFC